MRSQLLALALLCCACHSSHDSGPPLATQPSFATGQWAGTWRDTAGNSGNVTLAMTETTGEVAASARIIGSQCVADLDCRGTTNGFDLRLRAANPNDVYRVEASYYEDGNRLIGTFDLSIVTQQGICVGDGTFDLRRVGTPPLDEAHQSGELVIVDRDGNLTRRTVTVLR